MCVCLNSIPALFSAHSFIHSFFQGYQGDLIEDDDDDDSNRERNVAGDFLNSLTRFETNKKGGFSFLPFPAVISRAEDNTSKEC